MKYFIILMTLIIGTITSLKGLANPPTLLDEVYVDYKNHALVNPNNRSPLLYPESIKETLDLHIKMTTLGIVYMNPTVKSWTTDAQYRIVGLELELGLHLSDYFDIFYYHESLHMLDKQQVYLPRYPVDDAVGVRVYLYRSK